MAIGEQLKQRLAHTSVSQRIALALGISLLMGALAGVVIWSSRPDYQVLFSRLAPEDAAAIIETLKQDKVPYRLQSNGTSILVPRDRVYELRLSLASAGLPSGGGIGFEIFDDTPLGTTEFVQRLNYQRALQGELSRTISQFEAVSRARVHVVTPKESLFVAEQEPATASVVVRLRPGKRLSKKHIEGLVHLVSSAVEGLEPENISVVDMDGGVLYSGHRQDSGVGLSSSQLQYQRELEDGLERRIQEMLDRVVGPGRAVARVATEVDFRRIDISEERYDPDTSVIRSEQRQQETSTGGTSLPEGAPEEKYQYGQGAERTMVSSKTFRKQNEVINYEVNRVKKQIVGAVGDIKRLSAAVIIDGTYESKENGEGEIRQVYVPRSDEEIKRFEEIVKKAIGYDPDRGDQVEVINLAFAGEVPTGIGAGEGPAPWYRIGQRFAVPVVKLLVAVLVFFFVIRPLIRWLGQVWSQSPGRRQREGLEMEGGGRPEELAAAGPRQQLVYLARKDPEMTAELVRGWLNEEKED
jgi:flagellar M-ring protein FliF